MNRKDLPIFFLHVEKCAGTSVASLLRASFEPDEICPQPPFGTWTWHAREVRRYNLYWGHFSTDFIAEVGRGGTRLTMMRHPLARVISLFDYWRSHRWEHIRTALPPHPDNGPLVAKSGSLDDFLGSESKFVMGNIYNTFARRLLGRRFESLQIDEGTAIAESIAILRTFAWVGISESFESSVRLLSALLDLAAPATLPQENSTYAIGTDHPTCEPIEKTRPSDEQRARIMEGNRIDGAIYQAGRAMLSDMLSTCAVRAT